MDKIDTLSMTQTAEKPYPYIAHIREFPPGNSAQVSLFKVSSR